jgi:hypothetical protein
VKKARSKRQIFDFSAPASRGLFCVENPSEDVAAAAIHPANSAPSVGQRPKKLRHIAFRTTC